MCRKGKKWPRVAIGKTSTNLRRVGQGGEKKGRGQNKSRNGEGAKGKTGKTETQNENNQALGSHLLGQA